MASGKEIRSQISSIKNTQKITKAMEMVAASKMRKAQERMAASRPYAEKMIDVVRHLGHAHTEYRHPYLIEREVKRVGYIVISSDKGLCGGLNTNVFKETVSSMKAWKEKDIEIDICVVGSKAAGFFKRIGGNVISHVEQLGDEPSLEALIGSVKVMLDDYNEGQIDRLFVVFNKFINTMTQQPIVGQMLPIGETQITEHGENKARYHEAIDEDPNAMKYHWDYLYEPDAEKVIDALLMRYIESLVYQSVVENIACEMGARMIAMKSATDNAGDMIDDLQLVYNKSRQAAITQELSEIVAGAAAV